MLFYDANGGTNPKKVRIFLAEKGLEVPKKVIDLMNGEQDSPEYRKINSLGLCPALELDDGTVITESLAICRYFEAVNPDPPLFGTSPREIGLVDMWARRLELEVLAPAIAAFRHTSPFFAGRGAVQIPDYAAAMKNEAVEKLRWLDGEFSDGREYAAGDFFSMADIVAMSTFGIYKVAGVDMPDDTTNVTAWKERVCSRPSMSA